MKIYTGSCSAVSKGIKKIKGVQKAEMHNQRKYTKPLPTLNSEKNITLESYPANSFVDAIKEILKEKGIEQALQNYNSGKQKCRQIADVEEYLKKIDNAKKQNIANETILQYGSMEMWEEIKAQGQYNKQEIINFYKDLLKFYKKEHPNTYVISATLHFDESSPHLHVVDVQIEQKANVKRGLSVKINRSIDFKNQESLSRWQDNIHHEMQRAADMHFSFNAKILPKNTGRKIQLSVAEYKQARENLKGIDSLTENELRTKVKEQLKTADSAVIPVLKERSAKEREKLLDLQNNTKLQELKLESLNAKLKHTEDRNAKLERRNDLLEKTTRNYTQTWVSLEEKCSELKDELKKMRELSTKMLSELDIVVDYMAQKNIQTPPTLEVIAKKMEKELKEIKEKTYLEYEYMSLDERDELGWER